CQARVIVDASRSAPGGPTVGGLAKVNVPTIIAEGVVAKNDINIAVHRIHRRLRKAIGAELQTEVPIVAGTVQNGYQHVRAESEPLIGGFPHLNGVRRAETGALVQPKYVN